MHFWRIYSQFSFFTILPELTSNVENRDISETTNENESAIKIKFECILVDYIFNCLLNIGKTIQQLVIIICIFLHAHF